MFDAQLGLTGCGTPGTGSQWVALEAMTWSCQIDIKDPNKNDQWQVISKTNPNTSSGWQLATNEPN
jgi:hypothetical protein